jgi:hypothetical protein
MPGMSFSALGRIARPALHAPGDGQAEHALPRPRRLASSVDVAMNQEDPF